MRVIRTNRPGSTGRPCARRRWGGWPRRGVCAGRCRRRGPRAAAVAGAEARRRARRQQAPPRNGRSISTSTSCAAIPPSTCAPSRRPSRPTWGRTARSRTSRQPATPCWPPTVRRATIGLCRPAGAAGQRRRGLPAGQRDARGARAGGRRRVPLAARGARAGAVAGGGQGAGLQHGAGRLSALNRTGDQQVVPLVKQAVPGTMDVDLKVQDSNPWRASLGLNNDRSADTKPLRMTATLGYDNLWQLGHRASVSFFGAPQDLSQTRCGPPPMSRRSRAPSGRWKRTPTSRTAMWRPPAAPRCSAGPCLRRQGQLHGAGHGARWHAFSLGSTSRTTPK